MGGLSHSFYLPALRASPRFLRPFLGSRPLLNLSPSYCLLSALFLSLIFLLLATTWLFLQHCTFLPQSRITVVCVCANWTLPSWSISKVFAVGKLWKIRRPFLSMVWALTFNTHSCLILSSWLDVCVCVRVSSSILSNKKGCTNAADSLFN